MSVLTPIRAFARREPALTGMIVNWAAGAVAGLMGHPDWTGVFGAAGLVFLGVRAKVTPTTTAEATSAKAAAAAAIEVAKNLTADTAGAVGEVTGTAARVIDEALELVTGGGKK